jgi:O-antigen ligase
MAALFVVTLALAAVAGDRRLKLVAAVTAVVVLVGAFAVAAESIGNHSARRFTSDRSRRIELTVKAFRDHPAAGVGLGSQPVASKARSKQGGSPTRFVSHTTPLTVLAELGIVGLAAYLAFLGGAAVLIWRVYRIDEPLGLGLGAVLLAQFVHSLAYSGFFEDPVTWLAVAVAASFMLWRADHDAILEA